MNDDTDVPPRSSRQNPAYRPTSDSPAHHRQRIQSDARQIHTRSVAPYLALCAQYGHWGALLLRNTGRRLRLCAHCVARIRLRYRPISRFALNTGSLSSRGCAPLTPGCILAPFQGAPFLPRHICHISHRQMSIPLAIFVTSAAGRCPFPLAIYGEGVADRPGVRSKHIFPLAIFVTSAVGRCPFPLAIYGEGVADRPGVRSDN